ncbi:hypothetical protein [Pseudarthrobacter sp. S9]|uniref:hypothetical protein n=1 Tax=Pseudarthrobacter sp. S9 TaxID=3418421 RepID=UPI003D011214
MLGIDVAGQGVGIGVEGQSPLPQERDPEGDEEDAADPARSQGLVPAADHELGHTGHVGGGGGTEEPQQHGFMQRDAREHQERQGSEERSDRDLSAVTHVAHVNNHARAGGYFTT